MLATVRRQKRMEWLWRKILHIWEVENRAEDKAEAPTTRQRFPSPIGFTAETEAMAHAQL